MNQKGRDFLQKKIEEVHKREVQALVKPKAPDIEQYLRGAFAAGTIKLVGLKQMTDNLKKAAQNNHIEYDHHYGSRRNRWDDDEDEDFETKVIKLSPWIFIEIPPALKKSVEEYQEKRAKYNEAIKNLHDHKDNLLMKIQIGSDKMLAPLVDQVDAAGTLQLMNSRVVLIDESNRLGDGKSK